MEIIPAIDIRGGRCVRLVQGDYDRETVFDDDPAAVAARWQAAGARRLHVVDLDGAREGRPVNRETIERIRAAATVPLQAGGGIRDETALRDALDSGVERVVLGTAAVKDESFLRSALERFGEAIVVGVDARDGVVVTEGWLDGSSLTAEELVRRLAPLGVSRIVYTDTLRDGTLSGPNFEGLKSIIAVAGTMKVIASGGVSGVDHLRRLADAGAEAAIVGRALYTGDIDLAEAISVMD